MAIATSVYNLSVCLCVHVGVDCHVFTGCVAMYVCLCSVVVIMRDVIVYMCDT